MVKILIIVLTLLMGFTATGAAPGIEVSEVRGTSGLIDDMSVRQKYHQLTMDLTESGLTITTMESCTAGQVASLLTDTEGASAILKGAFVTCSNEAKLRQGVPAEIIDSYGVCSPQCVIAMAEACRAACEADIGIGITGSFGNVDPNNPDSVPGEVYFAIATRDGTRPFHCTVPPQTSRLDYKLYMADVIVDQLSTEF